MHMNSLIVEDRRATPVTWHGLILVGLLSVCGPSGSDVSAEDRVFLRNPDGRSESRVVGEVEEYTGAQLVLRHGSGRQQTFPATRVVRVESDWSAQHQKANSLFRQHAYQQALDAYLTALRGEKRKWVQRQQLAEITWCYRNLGKLDMASQSFLAIYRQDATTMHFPVIPLVWRSGPLPAGVERRAAALLANASQPAGQLIAASWLLSTSKRSEALQTLRSLSNATDARILFLAEAQIWRTKLTTFTDADLVRLQSRLQAMPSEIRAGPYFLTGAAHSAHGNHEQAALAWMRIPINYPQDRPLAAQALIHAGRELETLDRREAQEVYREVIVSYADTSSSATAQQRYKTLQSNNKTSSDTKTP